MDTPLGHVYRMQPHISKYPNIWISHLWVTPLKSYGPKLSIGTLPIVFPLYIKIVAHSAEFQEEKIILALGFALPSIAILVLRRDPLTSKAYMLERFLHL